MKYIFFVQSEGRGHLTQALSLAEELRRQGHEIISVIMNQNPVRKIPDFFISEIAAPIHYIKSPYFLISKDGAGIDFRKSIIFNLLRLRSYIISLKTIHKLYKQQQPDAVINFFEPLCGIYNLFFKNKVPCFSVGHQFFIEHPVFNKPEGRFKDYDYISFYNHLTSYGSTALLALSFTKEVDVPDKKIFVCPPLIRQDIKKLTPARENFILSYMLNPGYCEEIKEWSNRNPEQRIEAFWDKKGEPALKSFHKNLNFHLISGQKFLDLLQNCSTYISTGGFDSIAEAAYLQKNILMVPVKNQYEQLCNAHDALRANLAIFDSFFNIDAALENQKIRPEEPGRIFKSWVDNESHKIIDIITTKKD